MGSRQTIWWGSGQTPGPVPVREGAPQGTHTSCMRLGVHLTAGPQVTFFCAQAPWLVHTASDARLPPRSRPQSFPSQVLPILSVSNQLALALGFIRGLKKLGFSLEFIKAEWSGACRPPLPVRRAWAPHPHPTATKPCPSAGSQPGGPEEEARRVTLHVLRVLRKGPGGGGQTQGSVQKESRPLLRGKRLPQFPTWFHPLQNWAAPSPQALSLPDWSRECPPPPPPAGSRRLLSFPLGLVLHFWKRAGRPRAGSLGPCEGPLE